MNWRDGIVTDRFRVGYSWFRSIFGIKESEDKSMIKTTMKIDGMMCGMCEAHVCDAIRKAVPSAKKVTASRKKKEASFLTDDTVDNDSLKTAITATGYTFLDIESAPCEKKGLFGWK